MKTLLPPNGRPERKSVMDKGSFLHSLRFHSHSARYLLFFLKVLVQVIWKVSVAYVNRHYRRDVPLA